MLATHMDDDHRQRPGNAALVMLRDAVAQSFGVTRVPASRAPDRALRNGALQHRPGGYFSVNGVRDGARSGVLLYQPQAAITGIVLHDDGHTTRWLTQARAEPGCLNAVQFGPSLQTTAANFLRLHGGAAPHVARRAASSTRF